MNGRMRMRLEGKRQVLILKRGKKMLKEGDTAVDFRLRDKDGKEHSLDDSRARFLVLYFYPKDNTPGCTTEARMFSKDVEEYGKLGAEIVGISGGDEKSKERFCRKNGLDILLLSDTDFSVSKRYGVYGEKSFMGRKYMGISRITFVIEGKKIIKVFDNVKPAVHSAEVLEFLRGAS